jgi:poly(A) polymerase/tRNA nucleotidyltransferase (CCA-adding enzyme)
MASEAPPFPVEAEVLGVLETLWQAGHGAYLVGGGVRDGLLGQPVDEWDIATSARPEAIQRVFPGASYKNRFGTVTARGLDVTTFRRDHRYADHRRPDSVTFSQDIFEDLARRDLTINAIAWGRRGPDAGARLVDPADGQADLQAGLVRAVGDPALRFDEDALRLLRAVRFAARLAFTIEPVTWSAMQAHAADVEYVSEERLGSEISQMIVAEGPSRAMRLLRDSAILRAALPELDALADAGTPFEASLRTLDEIHRRAPGAPRLAWAALLGELDGPAAARVLERMRVGAVDRSAIIALIEAARVGYDHDWTDADVRRYMGTLRDAWLDDLLTLRAARAADDGARKDEVQLSGRVARQRHARAPLTLADLAIDGRDLREALGVPEGPAVGAILDRLLADVIDDPSLNTRLTLLTRAGLVLDELVQAGQTGADAPAIR